MRREDAAVRPEGGRGMKLSVATNFDPKLVDAVSGYPVAEFFGKLPMDALGGGRASYTLGRTTKRQFVAHVEAARSRGIGFNYLMNAACLDNRESTKKGQKEIMRTLEFVEGCGIGSVTISLPFLLPLIKRRFPSLRVRVGVFARVDSVAKARYWEQMGADCITLESISVNRDFPLLENIRAAVGCELQLIVNSNCAMFCPLSGQHMVNLSHASQKGHQSRGFMIDYCVLRCSADKLKDPVNYLRSEFIRPEDLGIYREMGYGSFKVLERGAPTEVLAARVRAYSEGSFDGNLLDLIQPYGYKSGTDGYFRGGPFRVLMHVLRPGTVGLRKLLMLKALAEKRGMLAPLSGEPVYIDNSALEGFIPGFRGRDCRRADCADCGWCASYAHKAVRMDSAYRAEMLGMYEKALGEMHSGGLWGQAG